MDFEPQITDSILEMTAALDRVIAKKAPVDLTKMLRCLALDFITRFTYGQSMHAVQCKDFKEDVLDAFDSFATSNFMVFFPEGPKGPIHTFIMLTDVLVHDVANAESTVDHVSLSYPYLAVSSNSEYEKSNILLFLATVGFDSLLTLSKSVSPKLLKFTTTFLKRTIEAVSNLC